MLGIAIGFIFSAVVFTIYSKDDKAVRQFKQKRKQQDEEKKKQHKEQMQKLQKMQNDPQLKERRDKANEKVRTKLFEGLDDKDKKLLEEYLSGKKQDGKSDAEIIKQATGKAGMFMVFMMILIMFLVIALIFLTNSSNSDTDKIASEITQNFKKFISAIFPKMANAPSPFPSVSEQTL